MIMEESNSPQTVVKTQTQQLLSSYETLGIKETAKSRNKQSHRKTRPKTSLYEVSLLFLLP